MAPPSETGCPIDENGLQRCEQNSFVAVAGAVSIYTVFNILFTMINFAKLYLKICIICIDVTNCLLIFIPLMPW